MSHVETVGIDVPNLPGLNEEDVKAVGSSPRGKLLNRLTLSLSLIGAALIAAGNVLSAAGKDTTALKGLLKDWLGPELSSSTWLGYGLIFVFLSLVLVAAVVEWRANRRRRALQALAVRMGYEQSGYFRIGPYMNTAEDRAHFGRADRTHEKVLDWIERFTGVPLYLTGDSGSGKTSLLNAFVLPALRDRGWTVVEARAWQDPQAALRAALAKLSSSRRPRSGEDRDLVGLIEAAARRAQNRLLLVLDQFEEFVILADPEQQQRFAMLIAELQSRSVRNLGLLLVLRSDYQVFLEDIGLPRLRYGENLFQVARFTIAAANGFIRRSGLDLQPDTLDRLLSSAAELDETPGLVRPITLNVIGYVLTEGHRVAEAPDAGRLVRHYIERTVDHPNIRDFAPRILEQLITEQGTKQPRSEQVLSDATSIRLGEVRAVLNSLAAAALARPLDPAQGIWELSHDFVARAIARYLGRRRRDLLRRTGAYAATALLAVILGAGSGIIALSHLTTNALLLEPDSGFVVRPFDVVNDGVTYVLTSDGKLWRERSDMHSRTEVDDNVTQFQAMNDSLVYVLGIDHKLWREEGDMHVRSVVDGNVAQFQAMNDGVVYVLNSDAKLWRERSDVHNRSEVDDSVARFQALNDRDVYVLGRDMRLWREHADMPDRSKVEGYVLQFQALNESLAYVLRGDRELWRKQGDVTTWVDGNVENFQAMNDSLVYVLGRDRLLWRVRGDMSDRSLVDDRVEYFRAMDESLVYVLKTNGDLWREQGDPHNRSEVDVGVGRSMDAKGRIVIKSP